MPKLDDHASARQQWPMILSTCGVMMLLRGCAEKDPDILHMFKGQGNGWLYWVNILEYLVTHLVDWHYNCQLKMMNINF